MAPLSRTALGKLRTKVTRLSWLIRSRSLGEGSGAPAASPCTPLSVCVLGCSPVLHLLGLMLLGEGMSLPQHPESAGGLVKLGPLSVCQPALWGVGSTDGS